MNYLFKIHSNIKLFPWFNIFYNFRLYSVVGMIYFAQITHSYALAVSLFSITQLTQAIFEIPFGVYSDKYGRCSCLRIGIIASLISVIFFAIGRNYFILLIGVIFEGINRAAFSGNNDALIYESLLEDHHHDSYHHEFGKTNSWLELSGFIGTVIGSLIAIYSLSLLFWLSIIPQFIATLISLKFIEPKIHRQKLGNIYQHLLGALKLLSHNFQLRYLSLASIIGFAIGESIWSFQAVFYNLYYPIWITSLIMSLNFLTSSISFRISGRIISRFKALKVLLFQEIYDRLLYLIALIFPSALSPLLMASASVTYGISTTAKSSLFQAEFTNQQRATISSINSVLGNCLYAVVAIFIGYFADKYGITKSLLLGQICLISLTVIYLKLYLSAPGHHRQSTARTL